MNRDSRSKREALGREARPSPKGESGGAEGNRTNPMSLEAATERERIVAWLRNGARLYRAFKSNTGSEGPKIQADMCSSLADAISRGDHLDHNKGTGDE